MMRYFLLKNNLEKGPFTKEELMANGLQATDFVKAETGVGTWSLADRIPELNILLAEEKKKNQATEKPRYKITANHEVVEVKKNEGDTSEWQAANKNLQTEPKAFPRVPSAIPKQDIPKATPVTPQPPVRKPINTTPYIKKTATKNKKQAGNVNKEVFIPLLLIGVIGAGIWFAYNKFGDKNTGNSSTEEVVKPVDTIAANMSEMPADTVVNHPVKPVIEKNVKKFDSLQVTALKTRKDSSSVVAIAKKKDSVHTNVKTIVQAEAAKQEQPKEKLKGLLPPKKSDSVSAAETTAVKKPKVRNAISDYVKVGLNKNQTGMVKDLKINVRNISDKPLNIAVVEVEYYDANGKYQKGETFQTPGIGPGKVAQIKVPDSENSARIAYRVSLISGDNVYLMAK